MTTSAPATRLREIGQIAIPVRELERAVAFYRDVLGMTLLFQAPPGLAFFDCGGIRLMLSLPEGSADQGQSPVIYYRVADLKSSFDEIIGKGARIESEPHLIARMPDHELWMGFVRDSEDNLVGLMSERRQPAPGTQPPA
jgi:methylmalonyl-CoA/ethylmalonyl-CoA epimerase